MATTCEHCGTDARSCPVHAYELGRRHERNVYLEERAALVAQLAALTTRITSIADDLCGLQVPGTSAVAMLDAIDMAANEARTTLAARDRAVARARAVVDAVQALIARPHTSCPECGRYVCAGAGHKDIAVEGPRGTARADCALGHALAALVAPEAP